MKITDELIQAMIKQMMNTTEKLQKEDEIEKLKKEASFNQAKDTLLGILAGIGLTVIALKMWNII